MEKQTKITYILFGLVVFSILLHNAFYGLFKIEEPVFFTLTFVFVLGLVVSVIYNTIIHIKRGEPKDLWKLGWIGLFGLVGLIPGVSYGFFGFFVFFGFFGAKGRKWIKK
jgi:hypothetical protein